MTESEGRVGAPRLRFGLSLHPYDRWPSVEDIVRVVTTADELGYDFVSLPDHVVVPADGVLGTRYYDVFVLGSFLAARTRRIGLVLAALVVPYRNPIVQAKLISTLDLVSQGRLSVVAGTGWLRPEFEALGVDFERRGALTDEYLRAMRALWTEDEPAFHGDHVSFGSLAFAPVGVQRPHVPVLIGGHGPRVRHRIVELGDGWAPMISWGGLREVAQEMDRIRELASQAGREPHSLRLLHSVALGVPDPGMRSPIDHGRTVRRESIRGMPEMVEYLDRCERAGVTDLRVEPAWASPSDLVERLEWFADELIPRPEPAWRRPDDHA